MQTALIVVWVVALLVIAALLVLLMVTLKQRAASEVQEASFEPSKDILLFYYERESIRSTTNGRLWIRICGIAWDAAWQNDLLRLEVCARDPASVSSDVGTDNAQAVAAYEFRAYRMTDDGSDIQIDAFLKPIDVIFVTAQPDVGPDAGPSTGPASGLEIKVRQGEKWIPAQAAHLPPEVLAAVTLPRGEPRTLSQNQQWVAASISVLAPLCVIRIVTGLRKDQTE